MAIIRIERSENPMSADVDVEYIPHDGDLLSLLNTLDIAGTRTFYNDADISEYDENPQLKDGDCIKIYQSAEWSYVISFVVSLLVGAAIGYYQKKQMEKKLKKKGDGKADDLLGLTYSQNQARNYQPVSLVLGSVSVTPDLHNQQWLQYVYSHDSLAYTRKIDVQNTSTIAVKDPSWTPLSNPLWLGDNQPFETTIYKAGGLTIPSPAYPYMPLDFSFSHSFVYNDDILSLNYQQYAYGYEVYMFQTYGQPINWFTPTFTESFTWVDESVETGFYDYIHKQQLNALYNFGFGDLEITNARLQSTQLSSYREAYFNAGVNDNAKCYLAAVPEMEWYNSGVVGYNEYPSRVISIGGGELLQNANVSDSGWITRDLPDGNIDHIALDFSGQLYENEDDGSTSSNSIVINIQTYNDFLGIWIDSISYTFEDGNFAVSPTNGSVTLTGRTRSVFRRTVYLDNLLQKTKIRVRKETPDSDNSRFVDGMNLEQFKFVEAQFPTGQAQTVYSLTIDAGTQLNGQIEALNADVSMKCWVYTQAVYGGEPIGGANWAWQATSNPAWLALYYMIGGYLNGSPPASFPDTGRGWMLGKHASNGARIFGCGIDEKFIDLYSIVDFAQNCATRDMRFDYVVRDQQTQVNVLNMILDAGYGDITYRGGKIGITYEAAAQPLRALFGMSNIIANTFSITYTGQDEYSEFIGKYNDASDQYAIKEVKAQALDIVASYNPLTVDLKGVTRKDQAQRAINLIAARQYYKRRQISFETDIQGLLVGKGDIVLIAHDMTQWAYSGRCFKFKIDAGQVTSIILDCELPADGQDTIIMQRPDGTLATYNILPLTAPSQTITLASQFPAADAPEHTDQYGAQNLASQWYDSDAEDFIYLAGFSTIGKRARVVSIEQSSEMRVRIICEDDPQEMYLHEFDHITPAPIGYDSGEKTIASVRDFMLERVGNTIKMQWQLVNADACTLVISVNGMPPLNVNCSESYETELSSGNALNVIVYPSIVNETYKRETYTFSGIV